MSTQYVQEQQIKRLQKFIITYAGELNTVHDRNVIQEALNNGTLREGDLYTLPY